MERLFTVKFLQHLMVFSARLDLPCGIPKGDAWLAQESDRAGGFGTTSFILLRLTICSDYY